MQFQFVIIETNLDKLRIRKKMKFKLITFSNNMCTVGTLYDEYGKRICDTMEKPWLGNKKDVSCVGAGVYEMIYRVSPSKGETFYLSNPKLGVTLDTPNTRTYVQIDKANIQSELLGCIAVGNGFGIHKKEWAVWDSKNTKAALMKLLGKESHT